MARRRPTPVSTPAPPGAVAPALDVVVKSAAAGVPEDVLPAGSRVLPVAPALPKRVQTPEADYLRRCFQVVLPAGADAAAAADRLRASGAVETVSASPRPELPG
jgi:hypothetical protein